MQDKADAANGPYQCRLTRAVDLPAKPTHMDVDEVRTGIEAIIPYMLKEHRARGRVPLMPHQIFQKSEFAREQVQGSSAPARGPRQKIQLQIADIQAGPGTDATKMRLGASHQRAIDAAVSDREECRQNMTALEKRGTQ